MEVLLRQLVLIMDPEFAAWLKGMFGSENAGAGPGTQAATPSTASQPQPNVPYAAGSVPDVPPTTTTSDTHDARTEEELYHADVSYSQDCHPSISADSFHSHSMSVNI